MKGKLLFVVGAAAGYVIGARAGRPAYDAIVKGARRAASEPHVRTAVGAVAAKVEQAAPAVTGAAATAGAAVGAAASVPRDATGGPAPASGSIATGAVPGGADEASAPTSTD